MRGRSPYHKKLIKYRWAIGGCVVVFCLLMWLANNIYWSASPSVPGGEYILFGRVMPDGLGRLLWSGILPGLVLTAMAGAWFLYRLLKTQRLGPQEGLCPACGYDLRASPERCPECGAAATAKMAT